jgi:hypothetical protein
MSSKSNEGKFTKVGALASVAGVLVAVAAILVGMHLGGGTAKAPSAISPKAVQPSTPAAQPTSPGASPSPTAPVSTASPVASIPSLVTYIEDLEPTPDSAPYDNRDIAQINGNSYTHSQAAQFCFGSNERKWTYVLGRKYTSFRGTIGLSDNSVATAKIRFELLADGRPVYSRDLRVGQSARLNVPVRNVLHLELDTTLLTQDGGCGAASGEWANIHAVGS